HQLLVQFLFQQGFAIEAIRLRDLRYYRNQCDYDPTVATLDAIAPQSLQTAQQVIERFSEQ
ncbi:MAG: hypothetical protein NZM28_10770, partial [Fimbriimonadales bacterium]|nr:hypothetical protein [Fimbriimonadales bacterium]